MFWVFLLLASCAFAEIQVVNEWPVLRFNTPFNYPTTRDYDPARTVFTGVEVGWDKIYLSLPRIWQGNPATIATIPRSNGIVPGLEKSPNLEAYPSWNWHAQAASGNIGAGNCSGLISVFRMRADRCNRLWVLDSGVFNSLVTFDIICPPRLMVFDMRNDEMIRSISLPAEVTRRNTLLTNLILDDERVIPGNPSTCDDMYVYMSDTTNPGLIVYNAKEDTTWRLQNPMMFPSPDHGTYKVAGESFTLMDGIIGLALTPIGVSPRLLYFQPFASDRLFSIPTSALQQGPNQGDDADLPVTLVGHKSSQAAGLTTDPRTGAVIFAPVTETAIASWVPGSPGHKVVAYDPELLQFILDFNSADRDSGTIWFLSTKFQKIWRGTLNTSENNLRILRIIEPLNVFNNNSLFLYKKK